ncbi:MAG: hypothetical protein R3316_04390 [Rhodovibrionaceae bacterium]|nr:hypothetical protein [Rhodovibrionaceae bacterium]
MKEFRRILRRAEDDEDSGAVAVAARVIREVRRRDGLTTGAQDALMHELLEELRTQGSGGVHEDYLLRVEELADDRQTTGGLRPDLQLELIRLYVLQKR